MSQTVKEKIDEEIDGSDEPDEAKVPVWVTTLVSVIIGTMVLGWLIFLIWLTDWITRP